MSTKLRTYLWSTVDLEFQGLGDLGYTGSLNDRLFNYLGAQGLVGSLTDRLYAFHLTGGAPAFSPLSLFASGEEGAWYEPSTTTAFKSTTDLTPCGYSDSCGFLLDKSKGAGYAGGSFTGLGSELVDFSAGVVENPGGGEAWVYDALNDEWSIGSGSDINDRVEWANIMEVGKTYLVSFSWTGLSGGAVRVAWPGDTSLHIDGSTSISGASGSQKVVITPASGQTSIWFRIKDAGGSVTFTSLSVRELPGNHATQVTAGARPILARVPEGGRRNELSETDTLATQSVTVTAAQRTLSFTGTGTITLTGASTAGLLVGTGAADRVSLTFTPSAGSLTLTVLGTVTDAQLELGATATTYQSVADSLGYDITEAGVTSLDYLSFDGSDDGMATASIDFTATDKMSVFAGVRRLIDSAGVIAELSPNWNNNTGSWLFFGGSGVNGLGNGFNSASRGGAAAAANQFGYTPTTFTPPATAVLTAAHDIPGDLTSVRGNGVAGTIGSGDKGAGNFGNYPLYIGARGGSSIFFDGKLFSLIVRGAASTAQEISDTESYVANLSGVTL